MINGFQGFGYITKNLGLRNRILWFPKFVYPRDDDWDYSDKRAKAIELGQFLECVTAPMHIWELETPSQKFSSKQDLEKENQGLKEKIGGKRKRALEPGTEEFQVLSEINTNIQRYNDSLRQSGQSGTKGLKRKKKPEQV